jgi:hypothetical protein
MKKFMYILVFFIGLTNVYSQRNGMSYQALIMNPSGEEIPGYNNNNSPLLDKLVCVKFSIIDHNGSEEYIETQTVSTDSYGMVNLTIGEGVKNGGYSNSWNDIVWDSNSKELKIYLDATGECSVFYEISNQYFHSVPFALYAANAGSAKSSLTKEEKERELWADAVEKIKEAKRLLDLEIITRKEYEKLSSKLKKIILKK